MIEDLSYYTVHVMCILLLLLKYSPVIVAYYVHACTNKYNNITIVAMRPTGTAVYCYVAGFIPSNVTHRVKPYHILCIHFTIIYITVVYNILSVFLVNNPRKYQLIKFFNSFSIESTKRNVG